MNVLKSMQANALKRPAISDYSTMKTVFVLDRRLSMSASLTVLKLLQQYGVEQLSAALVLVIKYLCVTTNLKMGRQLVCVTMEQQWLVG